jgi:putative ABC transport system permease protein
MYNDLLFAIRQLSENRGFTVGTVPQCIGTDSPKFGVYSPVAQTHLNFLSYVIRVKGDPGSYQAAIQRTVTSVMPDILIYNVQTKEKGLANSYWQKKFFSRIFSSYGLVALFLASLGIYGVMAYSVTQRTQEIGVRMALGAQPSDVLRLVGRQGLKLVGFGMGLGLAAALGLTRFMAGFLYGVSPSDPPTYFALSGILALVALVACWLPARRAALVDPMIALRMD